MAVRKFIDDVGATQLNNILAAKFDTKQDKVMASKTYTDIIGVTDNNWINTTFYFASVRPTLYTETWTIKYRIYVWVPNNNNYRALSDAYFMGTQGNCSSYALMNQIFNTSYRPVYYHTMYRLKQAGFDAGYGHAIGFSLRDSTNRLDTTLMRSVKVEILEATNCTVTLLDTPVKWDAWTGTGTTNYGDLVSYNFSGNGLQEVGDANDTAYVLNAYYDRRLVGTNGVYGYNIITYDSDEHLQGFVKSYSTATSKTKNDATFRIGAPFYYYNSSTNKASGTYVGDNTLRLQSSNINLQYSTNCGSTLVAQSPVYLVGIPNGSTYTLADTWWTQTLPSTEDGKIYILLGTAYNTNQITWALGHPVYWYKNGAIRLYTDSTNYLMPTGGIPKTDLESAVQTSLGKADTALQTSSVSGTGNITVLENLQYNTIQVSTSAEPNVLEGVQVDGTDLTITNKKVNITGKQDTLTAGDYISIVNNVIDTVGTTIYPLEDSSSHYIYQLDTGIYVGNGVTYKYKAAGSFLPTDVSIAISGRSVAFINREDSGANNMASFCIFEYIHNKIMSTYSTNMKIYYGYGEFGISGSKITAGGVHNVLDFSTIEKTSNKVTSISSSSTDTQYPSAKLLYDQLALKANTADVPQITYSDTDLTPGTSTLDTGTFYFVYE